MTAKQKYIVNAFLLLCIFACISLHAQTEVTIESARKTEYTKDAETENELIVLSGSVRLSVTKQDEKSIIQAEYVVFDRKRKMIYASGAVILEHVKKDSTEKLTGDSLLFNTDTMDGIFEQGTIIQSNASGSSNGTAGSAAAGSQNHISAEMFGRTGGGTTAFDSAALTFCEDPNPHWQIKASKIWLLPGNEFAFLNAVLLVGKIPVFYLPVFYLPKEEMFFNPVFGYRVRDGYFLQTTTYILGRKPLEKADENNAFSFTSQTSSLKEQRLDGFFLRNLDASLEKQPVNSLKILADIYSGLGIYTGIEGNFVPNKEIKKIDFKIDLGFSKNLYPIAQFNMFTPYNEKGEIEWNESYLFAIKLPFRYLFDFAFEYVNDIFSMSISLPAYSDPFFKNDFFNRKETMDWFGFLTDNPAFPKDTQDQKELSAYTWNMNMKFKPEVTILNPYITVLEVSRFTSGVNFASRSDITLSAPLNAVDPRRKFFFPTNITPLSTDMNITGTLVKIPPVQKKEQTQKTSVNADTKPEVKKIPKQEVPQDLQPDKKNESEKNNLPETLLPTIGFSNPSIVSIPDFTYSLDYSFIPKFSSEMQYTSQFWDSAQEIKWDEYISSFYLFSTKTALKSLASWRGSFLSLLNTLTFFTTHQEHPELSSLYYTEAQSKQITLNDLKMQKQTVTLSNALAFKPFYFNPVFSSSSLTWNSGVKLLKTEFAGTLEDPSWTYIPVGWNKESFDTHNITAVFSANINEITQSLTLMGNLPPLLDSYTGSYRIQIPISFIDANFSSQLGIGYYKKSEKENAWLFYPFTLNNTFTIVNMLTLSQEYTYDIEKNTPTRFTLNLSGYGAKLSYAAYYGTSYVLDAKKGWSANPDQEFIPSSLSASYTMAARNFYSWGNRIKLIPSLDTSLSYNMIRPTESYFTFTPACTVNINKFINITFSAQSRNDVIFRYIQDAVGFTPRIPGETNIFKDLWNSFSFWDTAARQKTGFKLKSLSIKIEHDLHDWQLNTEFTVKPRLITTTKPYSFDFSPYFSLSVSWKPFKGLKTNIVDEYGTFILNP